MIRIADTLISEANAPTNQTHFTIWVQGCSFICPGCFNPPLQPKDGGSPIKISTLVWAASEAYRANKIDGITLTGGEPLQQPEAILKLVKQLNTEMGIVILSGMTESEIKKLKIYDELIKYVDVIIAGRFIENKKIARGLRGSSNKKYLFYSDRYTEEDFDNPTVEIIFDEDGTEIVTGMVDSKDIRAFTEELFVLQDAKLPSFAPSPDYEDDKIRLWLKDELQTTKGQSVLTITDGDTDFNFYPSMLIKTKDGTILGGISIDEEIKLIKHLILDSPPSEDLTNFTEGLAELSIHFEKKGCKIINIRDTFASAKKAFDVLDKTTKDPKSLK